MVAGRPRDTQIDQAVLVATVELLEEVGYLALSVGDIASRAGTSKPAIYRRWPTKAHLVHEAVFPAVDFATTPARTLRGDIRGLLKVALELLGRPAARAALPGLLAETASDGALAAQVLGRAASGSQAFLSERLSVGAAQGKVRRGVSATTVFELIAGAALLATTTRASAHIDDKWVDGIVDVIVRGIAP